MRPEGHRLPTWPAAGGELPVGPTLVIEIEVEELAERIDLIIMAAGRGRLELAGMSQSALFQSSHRRSLSFSCLISSALGPKRALEDFAPISLNLVASSRANLLGIEVSEGFAERLALLQHRDPGKPAWKASRPERSDDGR